MTTNFKHPYHQWLKDSAGSASSSETSRRQFVQVRHRPPQSLTRPRELLVACPQMKSAVNLSQILRMAGSSGVSRVIACGRPQAIGKIARDAAESVTVEHRRSLPPVLRRLKAEGYELVGLEQTTHSELLTDFQWARRTVLVVGNERGGISQEVLDIVDRVVEIPVYGRPFSYNAATASMIAMYEYCRQFPTG